jgi:hypothetical protein
MADLTVTPASVIPSANAVIAIGTAGATIVAGQTLYIDTANSNVLKLYDADGSALTSTMAGIALGGAASGQQVRYVTQDPALVLGCTMAVGDTLWGSDTAGGITATFADLEAGDYITCIGVCTVVNSTINFKMIPAGAVKA